MAQTQPQVNQGVQPAAAAPAQEKKVDALPERPQLAPNVELRGEMQESGFEEQQWLVQRDGSYLQLTELLYRVAEQANGERTHDEMAAAVSDAIGRRVSADNIRQLLQKKLIPMGLVVKADGSVADVGGEKGGSAARSPLAVNMRMKMISPAMIEPITAVLQVLWKPPILITILGVAAAAHVWLYFIKGVAGGFREALYQPGLLLVLLGIIVLSAAFHEFGHASALRYGGGKVGGMGAGLYLIYPAFYTDVTDNYRLSRWNRIRTDLGGFYFNLIFELGLLGLYFLTGQEFLLVAILLLDLEIVHQSLPFVRLDGYWALADLTGIPDFFSHIGPYLRTVLPLPWWKGRTLPNLKPWVKTVFGLYILITVPLLLFLLFAMVKGVPRVLATAWDSFRQQVDTFGQAQASGDVLGMAAGIVQMITLALPTFGLLFILYKLGRRLITAIWNWSKPTPTRRVIGSLGSAAVVALLVFLWAPQLPFMQQRQGPLYTAARDNFVPLQPDERGTVGDVVRGRSNRERNTDESAPGAVPAVSPTAGTPTPTRGTVTPTQGTVTPTRGTTTPTATRVPTATSTATPRPAPTTAPAVQPPAAPAPTTAPPAPTTAPPAPTAAPPAPTTAPPAPTAAPSTAPPTATTAPATPTVAAATATAPPAPTPTP